MAPDSMAPPARGDTHSHTSLAPGRRVPLVVAPPGLPGRIAPTAPAVTSAAAVARSARSCRSLGCRSLRGHYLRHHVRRPVGGNHVLGAAQSESRDI